jgi:N-acetyl-alpha-D-glucosaminyl L-malate synthase BshA
LHGTDITLLGKDASFEPVISFAINQSDAVTAVSHSLKNDTYKLFGINKDIEVIPNFVNLEKLDFPEKEEMRKEYAPDGESLLVHISNFRPVKRITDVIEVFARIHKEVSARLILVGDGPDRSKAEQLCRELDLCDKVMFMGNVKNPTQVLSIADLFLLPSESESFGLAALEAMACSVPVISTNTGGLPEVNRHGVTGMMSNVGDVEDMAKNVLYMLADAKRLAKFRVQSYARASDFTIDKILPMYQKLYQSVLAEV